MALAISVSAQTYSRWNYSTLDPKGMAKDKKVIDDITSMLGHATGDVRFHKNYTYSITDSSFSLFDVNESIVRVFNPVPDGATELARQDTVVVLSKHSPFKKTIIVGTDGILPENQTIKPIDSHLMQMAQIKAKFIRLQVLSAMNDGKEWSDKQGKKLTEKEKRAAVWAVETGKKKANDYTKKVKATGKIIN